MTDRLKAFRKKVLDPGTPSSGIRHLFCRFIRNHPRDPIIIQALGLLCAHRSRRSQPPSEDADRIFQRILLPLLSRTNTLVSAFYAMFIDRNIPNIYLLAVINAIKRSGKDPWWLIGVAVTFRPTLADRIFRRAKGSRTT